jgi:uncharacterized protein YdeI (YjbR/CyaY-like superfamily)
MTKRNNPKSFRAVLERAGNGPYWVVARISVDLKKVWPAWKSRRVCGTINGFAFRTSLLSGPKGHGYTLLVNKRMQTGAGAGPGDTVEIQMMPDLDSQIFAEPEELTNILRGHRQLRKWFDAMSPSMRKGFGQLVDAAKGLDTRKVRAERVAETVMLAMEGEQVVPPILQLAFQRQPSAHEGWIAMTPTQRRNHLLGIFYVQTVEGRERRAAKAVEECLRVARRKKDSLRENDPDQDVH